MASMPKRVSERIAKQISVFQRVLTAAKNRDVHESDTVTIVKDMLQEIFGFDKYTEVTSEQAIRGTFVDLAVKIDGTTRCLIEVKAIGLALNDNHLRQAVGYGAHHGISWVVLTNGVEWEVYRVKFERPIDHELVFKFNFLELSSRRTADHAPLFLLCKEGISKDAIEEFHERSQIINRFVVAAIVQSDPVISIIRREIRKVAPGAKVSKEDIVELMPDVLKREVSEGDAAKAATRRVKRATSSAAKNRATAKLETN